VTRGIIVFGAIAFILIILFGNTEEVVGACIMSYCKENVAPTTTRTYITNTHRQKVPTSRFLVAHWSALSTVSNGP